MPQREAHQAFMALLLTRRKKKARICFCEMIQETQVLEKKKKKLQDQSDNQTTYNLRIKSVKCEKLRDKMRSFNKKHHGKKEASVSVPLSKHNRSIQNAKITLWHGETVSRYREESKSLVFYVLPVFTKKKPTEQ